MQPLQIDCSKVTPTIVKVTLTGTVDHTNVSLLKDAIDQTFEKGIYKLLLDLKGTEYVTSSGIACFIRAMDLTHGHGGKMVIIAAPVQMQRISDLLGLSEVFLFSDDETSALRLLGHRPTAG